MLSRALRQLDMHLSEEEIQVPELCKLTHAASQVAGTYARILEVGELEERLEELERTVTDTTRAVGGVR